MIRVRIAWFPAAGPKLWLLAGLAILQLRPAAAEDNSQLLSEFRKVKPDVSEVHVFAEQPLLVAVTGPQGTRKVPASWDRGELLGVFAHRGEQDVPISIVPNNDYPAAIRIDRQTVESITFGLSDPDYGVRSDDLKIFFDPKTLFPKRIVRFPPVQVRRISAAAGVLTVVGSDGKQDYTARERNGAWHVTTAPATTVPPTPPIESALQIPPMPVSNFGEFEQARPNSAKNIPNGAVIEERVGPYQKVGTRIWIGKSFYEGEGSIGVGDIGYYDLTAKQWTFLHIREMADWSASALLVEPDSIWVGLVRNGEGAGIPGGLLRYDRNTHQCTKVAISEVINKILRVGSKVYCGTSGGFAIDDQGRVQNFIFDPQLDGVYTVIPVP